MSTLKRTKSIPGVTEGLCFQRIDEPCGRRVDVDASSHNSVDVSMAREIRTESAQAVAETGGGNPRRCKENNNRALRSQMIGQPKTKSETDATMSEQALRVEGSG